MDGAGSGDNKQEFGKLYISSSKELWTQYVYSHHVLLCEFVELLYFHIQRMRTFKSLECDHPTSELAHGGP